MKKIISVILTVFMILSTLVFGVSADKVEWKLDLSSFNVGDKLEKDVQYDGFKIAINLDTMSVVEDGGEKVLKLTHVQQSGARIMFPDNPKGTYGAKFTFSADIYLVKPALSISSGKSAYVLSFKSDQLIVKMVEDKTNNGAIGVKNLAGDNVDHQYANKFSWDKWTHLDICIDIENSKYAVYCNGNLVYSDVLGENIKNLTNMSIGWHNDMSHVADTSEKEFVLFKNVSFASGVIEKKSEETTKSSETTKTKETTKAKETTKNAVTTKAEETTEAEITTIDVTTEEEVTTPEMTTADDSTSATTTNDETTLETDTNDDGTSTKAESDTESGDDKGSNKNKNVIPFIVIGAVLVVAIIATVIVVKKKK